MWDYSEREGTGTMEWVAVLDGTRPGSRHEDSDYDGEGTWKMQ